MNGAAAGPGTGTVSDPYASIQFAIDQTATVAGDTLQIATGVYDEMVDLRGKGLTLRAAGSVTIDRNYVGTGLVVDGIAVGKARIEGIQFKRCIGEGRGGAVSVDGSTLELIDCQIVDCQWGATFPTPTGGLHASNSNVSIFGARFDNCFGSEVGALWIAGGSLELQDTVLEDCQTLDGPQKVGALRADAADVLLVDTSIRSMSFTYVGVAGVRLADCTTVLADCVFEYLDTLGQTASLHVDGGSLLISDSLFRNGTSYGQGAHLHLQDVAATVRRTSFLSGAVIGLPSSAVAGNVYQAGGTATFEDCAFVEGNASTCGGTAFRFGAAAELIRCRFEDNRSFYAPAPRLGSALLADSGTSVSAKGCLFAGNLLDTGTAFNPMAVVTGPVQLQHCTLAGNLSTGAGFAVWDATLDHSIVWGNQNGSLGGSSTAIWSCLEGGEPGTGNFSLDPLLDTEFHLLASSPCIDAGDPMWAADADGSPRDVGAFPWTWDAVGQPHCGSLANSTGLPGVLQAFGAPAAVGGTLFLRSTNLPVQSPVMYLMSESPGTTALGGGGTGILCLDAPIGRFQSQVQVSDAQGTASISVDSQALPFPGGAASAGTTYWFQGWYRDLGPDGLPTSRSTTALSVHFQ